MAGMVYVSFGLGWGAVFRGSHFILVGALQVSQQFSHFQESFRGLNDVAIDSEATHAEVHSETLLT